MTAFFKKKGRKKYSFTLSLAVLLLSILAVIYYDFNVSKWETNKGVIQHDITQYNAYLPTLFIYKDISLNYWTQKPDALGRGFFPKTTPLGKKAIVATYGMSFLYSPFFFVGHALAEPFGYEANGLTAPYQMALQFSSLFYFALGLFFMRKILMKYFSDKVIALVILATVFGSNLFYYVTGEAPMTHAYSFCLITLFLFVTDKWVDKTSVWSTIQLGFLAGLISVIRPTNIIVVLLLVLWKVTSFNDVKDRFFMLLRHWHLILLMILFSLIVWMPQFYYWKLVSGQYFYYSYPDDQGFFFNNPQLYNNLFSWRKGWLIYTTVMAFSLIGMALMHRVNKLFFWPVLVYFLLSWYILSSWWDWWYGGGFGMRPYVDSYGVFAFGIAAFLTWTFRQRKFLKIPLITIFMLALLLGGYNNMRYHYSTIHFDSNTRETYMVDFFKVRNKPGFWETLRKPDYKLARKGIYRYEDESVEK
jgi:hypothetical protein